MEGGGFMIEIEVKNTARAYAIYQRTKSTSTYGNWMMEEIGAYLDEHPEIASDGSTVPLSTDVSFAAFELWLERRHPSVN
jgi:hypothetical protein